MACLNHVRLTKQSHFDREAHRVRSDRDQAGHHGDASVVRLTQRLTTNRPSRRGYHQATPPKGDRAQQRESVQGPLPQQATCHQTITVGLSIPSLKNRRAQWRIEHQAGER